MRLIGYYASWSIYGRNCFPGDLPLNLLTHLTLAFALPSSDGHLNLEELRKSTVERDSGVKIGVAVGGWGQSEAFLTAIRDKASDFVTSCLNLVAEFDLDYLEIDWEYPQTSEQTDLLRGVLAELKRRLPAGKELSVCLPCFQSEFSAKELEPFVDFCVLMAYDLAGPWGDLSGHHSALFPTIADHCDHLILTELIPKEKIVLGCPLYARTFSNCNGPDASFSGPGMGSFGELGAMDYKDCFEKALDVKYDPARVSCHAVNGGDFVSFDGPESIRRKCEWAMETGLGGLAFWHVAADMPGDNSLISIASTALQAHK